MGAEDSIDGEELVEDCIDGEELARRILEESKDEPLDTSRCKTFPPWFDEKKFKRGQSYFHTNYWALFVSKLSGLLVILAVPSILQVLIMTGKSSEPRTAFKRYLDTILHMLEWYKGNITDTKSSLHKSMMEVRGKHCAASKGASADKQYGHISQQDMALTQFGFMGFALIHAEYLGVQGSEEDVEGFLHLWRTVGHFMGIKDRYNLCSLSNNVAESRKCCQIICNNAFKPLMETPVEDFHSMSIALLQGVKGFVPSLDPDAFLYFTKHLCGIDVNLDKLDAYARFTYRLQDFIHTRILNNAILRWFFRPLLNFNMWLAIFICERFTSVISALHFGNS
uniref:ER-bound oxygenase mpaB/mpaB'/Rubber oxygenase catalytic domain-containing protein n=1 Tax=Cacopsylla melanoneura TaxID=428564 RepID=A0A8D8Y4E7_9HEMI